MMIRNNQLIASVLALLGLALAATPGFAAQGTPRPATGVVVAEPRQKLPASVRAPQTLSPAQVTTLVAPLTNAQTRELLIVQLDGGTKSQGGPAASEEGSGVIGFIQGLQNRSIALGERFDATLAALVDFPDSWEYIMLNLTGGEGNSVLFKSLGVFLLMVMAGLAVERIVEFLLGDVRRRLNQSTVEGLPAKLGFLLIRLILDLLAVAIFALSAYVVSFLFFARFDPMRVMVVTFFVVLSLVRTAHVLSRFALAPNASGIRMFPLGDGDARNLHLWLVWLSAVAGIGFFTSGLLSILGLQAELHRLFQIVSGLVLTLMLGTLVWSNRARVAEAICGPDDLSADSSRKLRQAVGQGWHILAMVYLAITWGIWSLNVMMSQTEQARAAVNSLLIILALPLADRIVHGLLGFLFRLSGGPDRDLEARRVSRYISVLQNGLRVVLVGVALLVLAQAWGLGVFAALETSLGRSLTGAVLNITAAVLIAYVVWEIVKISIDRHMPADEMTDLSEMEGEGGVMTPATRAQTLLPLLRTFVLIVLIVMVTMVVLSAMGINIGPLLAGAGVVGLAIGFGAQRLVQDVFSGFFFLIDDAFRIGEYVEAGGMKGTVESISIRSMQLRHHLGPVQTIPYSEIAAVKNHSRDWVIMKLQFRVPFDTDIEKVRKIIKKIGQEMKDDEEMGPHFIQPLKSQGVLRVEDSALILRMKFMTIPNEQWVIRREAYRRVQEGLRAAGIEFAHRQVTVHVPGGQNEDKKGVAGAAATAVVNQDAPAVASVGVR